MANNVTVKIIEGGFFGARNLIFNVFLQSDGASGELVNYVLMDPVTLGYTAKARFTLYKIDYNFAGFDGIVAFDAGGVTPNQKWVLVEGTNSDIDLHKVGGIRDDSGIDGTGKILLSTLGFTSSQDVGSIVFKFRMPS